MDPVTKLEMFFAKWGLLLLAGAFILLCIVGWLGYNSWRNSQNAAKIVNANRTVDKADTQAGTGAVAILGANQDKDKATDAKLPRVTNIYNTYPAAKVGVDPAFLAAFDKSLCVYRSAANLPQCKSVQ